MYEITKNIRTIEGVNFITYSRDIMNTPYGIQVESGTTGIYGNKEAATYIRIKNINGVKIKVNPMGMNGSEGVEIMIVGNSGLRLLVIGLKFIRKALIHCMTGKIF